MEVNFMRKLLKPYFERQLIEDKREDGYWIEAFKQPTKELILLDMA